MKIKSYLYEQILNRANIRLAIIKSAKGKHKRHDVQKILKNQEKYVLKIEELLKNEIYIPSKFIQSEIYDYHSKKIRIISKPKYYPDQIIQYCLMNILEPILLAKFYEHSCGNIPKKGVEFGRKNIRKWLDKDIKNTKYCLKFDIKKFYPSISKEILKNKFKLIIKDKKCLNLINLIIDSDCEGIPLGNYTSGYFANFYLNELDGFIKNKLKIKYYLRYVDDMILLSGNKKHLRNAFFEIQKFIKKEKIELKSNYQLFPIKSRDIDFLGFRFFPKKTILRKRNMIKINRKSIKYKDNKNYKNACSIISYYGWIKYSNSCNFYNIKIKPNVKINEVKLIISNHNKKFYN